MAGDRWGVTDRKPPRNRGKLRDELQAYLEAPSGRWMMHLHPEGNVADDGTVVSLEPGPSVHMAFKSRTGRSLFVNMTDMTDAELEELRKFLGLCFDLAKPIVLERDANAEESYARGDDSFARLNRPVPRLVVRSRAKLLHSEVVQLGLANVVARGWDFFRAHLGSGGDGPPVAPEHAGGSAAPDDAASSD